MAEQRGNAYEEHLSTLTNEIRDLERQLEDVSTSLARKRYEVADFVNSAAPVSAVPTEVLMQIFKAGQTSTSGDASTFALLVSHISRHWRDVALHSPFLWSIIHFGQGFLESEALLKLYLKRSGTCLLDVRLDFLSNPPHQVKNDNCTHVLPNNLLLQTDRWRRLSVNSSCTDITVNLLAYLSSKSAPALHSLEMSYTGQWEDDIDRRMFRGKGGAPYLSSMTLRNMGVTIAKPPLTSLVCLQIGPDENMSPWYENELLWVLRSAPLLRSLVIWHDLTIVMLEYDEVPIHVSSLSSLEIARAPSSQGHHISRLFSFIGAPNLECLILDFPNHDAISTFMDLLSEIPLSVRFPCLRTLTVHLHRVHDSRLVELCSLLPAVTGISSTWKSGYALLQFLNVSTDDVHWPQLQSISVSWLMYKVHLDLLCTVLTSRVAAGHPISRLYVESSFFNDLPRERIRWLEERVKLVME